MDLWKVLWDWYRGDSGILFEGEDLPSREDRDRAKEWVKGLDDNAVADGIRYLEKRGCFQHSGTDADDFFEWLEEIRWP